MDELRFRRELIAAIRDLTTQTERIADALEKQNKRPYPVGGEEWLSDEGDMRP